MTIVQEALENGAIHSAEDAFFEVLSHIHVDTIGILLQRLDAVLEEVFGELMVDIVAGAIEVCFADLAVPDDFLAEGVVRRAVLNEPINMSLDRAFDGRDFFFRRQSSFVVWLLVDGLDNSSKVKAVLAVKQCDLQVLLHPLHTSTD